MLIPVFGCFALDKDLVFRLPWKKYAIIRGVVWQDGWIRCYMTFPGFEEGYYSEHYCDWMSDEKEWD